MNINPTKQRLTVRRQQLIEFMQLINFGRIEGLKIVGGEPDLGSISKAVSTHKLKSENGPRLELSASDFLLKKEVVEIFRFLDQMQDGHIELIVVQHGLPILLELPRCPPKHWD
jgi:hypothetical protein